MDFENAELFAAFMMFWSSCNGITGFDNLNEELALKAKELFKMAPPQEAKKMVAAAAYTHEKIKNENPELRLT